jgi:hypothetical protein
MSRDIFNVFIYNDFHALMILRKSASLFLKYLKLNEKTTASFPKRQPWRHSANKHAKEAGPDSRRAASFLRSRSRALANT